ncbi:MAG: 4-hydroxy-tetrahydrodipicolinate synthase [Myxococcales bacterium]|nr:4-hydroxy-tetrahydrodipicolinate synthase [Myxococcales bacterium]
MEKSRLSGTFTALVTPFDASGAVDLQALDALVDRQLAGGVGGLVPCGTTGETPTLSVEEQLTVIRRVADRAAGRVPILAGTGSYATAATVDHSRRALEAGADAVMIVMPYYNKPSQAGMAAHVGAVAEAIEAPIVLYDIPGRSVVSLDVDTTEAICARHDNVIGLKDASGNVLKCQELKRRLGDRLTVMCGDDGLTLGMMACGASGVISVSSNVLPEAVSDVTTKLAAGDFAGARAAHLALLPLHGAMFVEPNPSPCKAAAALLGGLR